MSEAEIVSRSHFALEIDFTPGSELPARVFRTMAALIEAVDFIDYALLQSIHPSIRPTLLLHQIEAGSLRTWLVRALEMIEDDALKKLDWKAIVGSFLVKAKHKAIDYLNERPTIRSRDEILGLREELFALAQQTQVLQIPMYTPIPPLAVAESIRLLSDATASLQKGDGAKYITRYSVSTFNLDFHVTPERIEELLTKEAITNTVSMTLKVKKPDFLGDSKWEFKHDGKPLEAKMLDAAWLSRFRARIVPIRPGDALCAVVRTCLKYGHDGEVIASHHEVLHVEDVIKAVAATQGDIFS